MPRVSRWQRGAAGLISLGADPVRRQVEVHHEHAVRAAAGRGEPDRAAAGDSARGRPHRRRRRWDRRRVSTACRGRCCGCLWPAITPAMSTTDSIASTADMADAAVVAGGDRRHGHRQRKTMGGSRRWCHRWTSEARGAPRCSADSARRSASSVVTSVTCRPSPTKPPSCCWTRRGRCRSKSTSCAAGCCDRTPRSFTSAAPITRWCGAGRTPSRRSRARSRARRRAWSSMSSSRHVQLEDRR